MHVDVPLQVELGSEALAATVTVVDGLGAAGVPLLAPARGLSLADDDGRPGDLLRAGH